MPPVAKVEPLTTARVLRGPFDYLRPEGVGVGSLLEIPFGRQTLRGVVTGLAEASEHELAAPRRVLEHTLPPDLVELALWLAAEYCSTPARALALVSPPAGARARTALWAEPTAEAAAPRLTDRQRELLASLPRFAGADTAALRRLERRGLVAVAPRVVRRRPAHTPVGARRPQPPPLTAEQQAALTAIAEREPGEGLLLHGITGSGKTEVYLAATSAALERGMGAIVLVPEIGLTPQTVSRFAARFGDRVAVLHSALSAGERRDEWERLRRGDARVCVGPRSAVFAPVDGLGLVVVDEEHDASYKQESDPRYDAREVARHRAGRTGAVLVCGSATPRPESWRALERLDLPERADGAPLPTVEVLDMRERDGREGPLHARTREALAEVAAAGGKAIVMAPRRGWSPHMSCRECGHAWGCPNCDVSLVLHRRTGLHCHHCGYAEPEPESCPRCGSVSVARHGAGTERLGALVSALVDPLPVFRLDSDSAARRGAHATILSEFDRAPGGVLLGTQMVGKGHDFPDVTLSVIVDADQSLRFPDFRAEERTFAQVAQLAGRSGRGAAGGRVLVQTTAPAAEAIALAAHHDAPRFLARELERRRELRYPPFATLVRVELTAPSPSAADAAAGRAAARLRPLVPPGARLLGPAPRFRLRGRERRQLLLKAPDREPAVDAVRSAVEALAASRSLRGVQLAVDVDPQ